MGGEFVGIVNRIVVSIAALVLFVFLGAILVGCDIVSAEVGLVMWVIGLAAAIAAFIRTRPKD